MKNKKKLITILYGIIGLVMAVVGVVIGLVYQRGNMVAVAALLMCVGAIFLFMGFCRMLAGGSADKEKKKTKQQNFFKRLNEIDEKLQEFKSNKNYPETNTVKIVGDGVEFYAEGRYVCKKDFNHVSGYHFAFEISTTKLKHMPEDYDDVCDLESTGVLISMGDLDGEQTIESGKVDGILMHNAPESVDGLVHTINSDGDDCTATVWTAEGDEVDYGFVKILNCDDDVLTIYFSLTVSYGLCDTVEGVVELKKVAEGQTSAIQSVINKIKRKRYNVIEVSAEEVEEIQNNNPFLPESYITFLKEVGFADMDWIDVGRNTKTPTNLDDDEIEHVTELLADYADKSVEDFYFFGIDCDGSYFAFSKNGDGKVYVFAEGIKNAPPSDTFEKFLSEIISA